jgi:Putative peptidoglycan binding domain/D-alanyl-D-alanine carboxypeptidase
VTGELPVLRVGSRGRWVGVLQTFLLGRGHYRGRVDNAFGPLTEKAVRAFQRAHTLKADGIVGNQTWGAAMMLGLELVASPPRDAKRRDSPAWPAAPADLRPMYGRSREGIFGHIEFKHTPTSRNPEAVTITNGWQRDNLVSAKVDQLARLYEERPPRSGFPKSGKIFCHRLAADPIRALWQAWEDDGLLDRVMTFQGAWVARFVRGSRTTLSNHCYGSAFDVNYAWNMLGHRPALVGQEGSLRELVPTANKLGFYWGGHFKRNDGMHFELVRLAG